MSEPMTVQQFVAAAESYFGILPPAVRTAIQKHIANWTGDRRRSVWEVLKATREIYPNKPLSVAEIEKARKEQDSHVGDAPRLPAPREELEIGAVDPELGAQYMRDILAGLRSGEPPHEVLRRYEDAIQE